MIKRSNADGTVSVTFELSRAVGATTAALCGDFNDWSVGATPMTLGEDGFVVSLQLMPGRKYRFRYLLDGQRWENDWAADAYVPNDFGGDDSVVDLIEVGAHHPAMSADHADHGGSPGSAGGAGTPGAAGEFGDADHSASPVEKAPAKVTKAVAKTAKKTAAPAKKAAKKAADPERAAQPAKAAKKAKKAGKKAAPETDET